MIAKWMIAGAAALALATVAGAADTSTPAAPAAKPAPKLTDKQVTDHEGNKLTLQLDDAGKLVKADAKDGKGTPLEVTRLELKDISVCVPKKSASGADAKPLCQPLAFVTDGAFFKMGTASCTCYVWNGTPVCYGNTCR